MILLAGFALTACKKDDATHGSEPDQKIQGTLDPTDFKHPLLKRPGFLKMPGCCTFDIGTATAEQLNGDSQIMIVRANGFEAELVFGFYEVLEKPSGNGATTVSIDGVILEKVSTTVANETRSTKWQASVPLTPSARKRGVVNPILKIDGKCRSDSACKIMDVMVNSIRF